MVGVVCLGALAAGCTDATITPVNQPAQAIGTSTLHYLGATPGGPIYVTLPDHRNLAGSLSIDEGPASPVTMDGGTAEYFGLGGGNVRVRVHDVYTTLACRALIAGGHGTGFCRDQNGGLYRLDM